MRWRLQWGQSAAQEWTREQAQHLEQDRELIAAARTEVTAWDIAYLRSCYLGLGKYNGKLLFVIMHI